mgnify:CR=1 FL=1
MQNNKHKIALLFPDGVGIKNYLYTNVFKQDKVDLVLLHNFDPETVAEIKKQTPLGDDFEIPVYKESVAEKFLRELICLSRLQFNAKKVANPSLLCNWKTSHKGIFHQLFYAFIGFIAPLFSIRYSNILFLENLYQKRIRKNVFYRKSLSLLKQINPSTLFCSHQRGLKAATVFAAATDLGIKTTTVIYSWDNLPKARLALRADTYLVWSDHMKEEIKLFYPEILQTSVVVTGTPQFECYANGHNIIDKTIFYKQYNLSIDKKIICFSGDDVKTSPDDPKYLNDIVSALIDANLQDQYQILFRRCPVDVSNRFDKVLNKYSDLIKVAPPLWFFNKSEHWTTIYPSKDDVKLLVSTAFYSDIVVNVGSTMAFDFAMFDKPCVFINYDQKTKNDPNWSVETIYKYQHFKSMPNKESVIWLNGSEEIITKLTKQFSDTSAMNRWKEVVLGNYQNASEQIQTQLTKDL